MKPHGGLPIQPSRATGSKEKRTDVLHARMQSLAVALASMSEAQLKKAYPLEYNSYRSRRDAAEKQGVPWDPQFETFAGFLRAMGPKPEPSYTLDKIVAERGYVIGNCQWRSKEDQATNRDTTRFLTIDGKTHSVAQWSRLKRVPEDTIRSRLRRGWSPADAVNGTINARRCPQTVDCLIESLPWPKGSEAKWELWYLQHHREEERRLSFMLRWAKEWANQWRTKCESEFDRAGDVPFEWTEQFEKWQSIARGAECRCAARNLRRRFANRRGAEFSPDKEARLFDLAMKSGQSSKL